LILSIAHRLAVAAGHAILEIGRPVFARLSQPAVASRPAFAASEAGKIGRSLPCRDTRTDPRTPTSPSSAAD
jgi:hypothetical protein